MAISLSSLRTPGVYVDEINLLPPSVAAVETAIPAFFGYTEFSKDGRGDNVPTFPRIQRIVSMLEYEQYFGKAPAHTVTATVSASPENRLESVAVNPLVYNLYYALQMYFANGGGPCFIVSLGLYKSTPAVSKADYGPAITALDAVDEPTLLVFPDAVGLNTATDYHDILVLALNQCEQRGDRFLLCDVYKGDGSVPTAVDDFRNGIGTNSLKYAAAYYPWLNTSMGYYWNPGSVGFTHTSGILHNKKLADVHGLLNASTEMEKVNKYNNAAIALEADTKASLATTAEAAMLAAKAAQGVANALINSYQQVGKALTTNLTKGKNDADAALASAKAAASKADAKTAAAAALTAASMAIGESVIGTGDLAAVSAIYTGAFDARLKQLIEEKKVTLPPTPAIAGIYARVDNTRGVWKAPANVSLAQVIQPTVPISDEGQRSLNVDDTAGKSVNAIRTFTGKGVLVWGARTLDGFSNEWRYVNVRRLFNMVEESVKKASAQFVFEPNDANTWVKIRAMIENFLTNLWRDGALAGAKPADAFRVFVGLNETMTSDDILNGRLIVEIHMAAVRPAEFIVLRFAHKMQVS